MKIVLLAASRVGQKSRIAMDATQKILQNQFPDSSSELLDLKELDVAFSDGRNYLDYTGDTGRVAKTLMAADVIMIGTPVFQATIPGSLKNIFDLLPQKAFFRKTVSFIITAGSPKHYLVGETQLKPILNYMKANLLPQYVFVEDRDFDRGQIVNDDVLLRLETLVEDTLVLAQTYAAIWQKQEAKYDF